MERINVSVVSYLNSLPFIRGLERANIASQINLQKVIPSVCAQKLMDGTADIGLVPVAVLPQLPNAKIITDYCIGASGNVGSVAIFSQVPLDDIKTILLDYESRTSVCLAKILAAELWKITPEFIHASPGFEEQIKGTTAAVVIGDKAIELELGGQCKYSFDLSRQWQIMTDLPFVFAVWVTTKDLSEQFVKDFDKAIKQGLDQRYEIMKEKSREMMGNPKYWGFDFEMYFFRKIHYSLDEPKRKAMELFLQKSIKY